jgi:hypothetical protein
MTIIPSNYRQLKNNEVIREGDLYTMGDTHVGKVKASIGFTVENWDKGYTFYRRRHVKIKDDLDILTVHTTNPKVDETQSLKTISKKTKPVTIVKFSYKNKTRRVQVIKFDKRSLFGLEIIQPKGKNAEYEKPTYKFKNFLRKRMDSQPILEKFE